ncbi:MAG: DUF1345 domain-containing protein [Verrucomicrobiota bacterium]|nr:DUF1345 domain-containing protein [Verrucomicrobiota bacterium]
MSIAATISDVSARFRLIISLSLAVVVWFVLRGRMQFATQMIATWDAFALSALLIAWVGILTVPHQEIRKKVQNQDVAGPLISVFVVVVSCAALLAVLFLLRNDKGSPQPLHIVLTLLAVISSWSLLHTVFGLHYAHTFYGDAEDSKQPAGGLDFPGEKKPDYLDFAYFSFVIGMTFQVSDVQVTAQTLRRLVLVHGILSFGFNTLILALAINTVTSLL